MISSSREPVAVELGLDQRRGQVVGRLLAALRHHVGVVDEQVDRRLDRRRRDVGHAVLAVHHAVGERPQVLAVLLGDPDQLRDHVHRQLAGEFGDEVEAFVFQGLVQMLLGELEHPGLQLADAARGEALRHQGAQPQVAGVVHGQKRHGPVGLGRARDRVERHAELVRQFGAVAKPLVHVGMSGQRPEAALGVVVERGLVTQSLVVRVGVLVELVVIRIEDQLDGPFSGWSGHQFSSLKIRPTT